MKFTYISVLFIGFVSILFFGLPRVVFASYTWTTPFVAYEYDEYWNNAVSDSDGTNLIASVLGGRLYTSSDSGVNWTERQPAGDADKQ